MPAELESSLGVTAATPHQQVGRKVCPNFSLTEAISGLSGAHAEKSGLPSLLALGLTAD